MSNKSVINTERNQYTIVRGEQRDMFVTLILSNFDYVPFDLTGRSDIKARFNGESSQPIELLESNGEIVVNNETAGQFTITIDTTTSNNLKLGSRQDFSVHVEYAAKGPRISKFLGRLNVQAPIGC